MKQIKGQDVIEYVNVHCAKIITDRSGWQVLYKNLATAEFWLLSYQDSEIHGSGEPLLTLLSAKEAQDKYIFACKLL